MHRLHRTANQQGISTLSEKTVISWIRQSNLEQLKENSFYVGKHT